MNLKAIVFVGLIIGLNSCVPSTVPPSSSPDPSVTASPSPGPNETPAPGPSASASVNPTVSPSASPSGSGSSGSPSGQPSPNPGQTSNPIDNKVSRIVFSRSSYRLFESGNTLQIEFQAFNAAGQVIPLSALKLSWSSSRPDRITVSETGLLTAVTSSGASEITLTEQNAGLSVVVNAEIQRSSGGGGGGGGTTGSTPTHNVSAGVDYSDVEFETEAP